MSNLSLAYLRVISKYQFINGRERQQSAERMVNRMRIKTPSLNQEVGNLSGGNQQKVVLGKALMTMPKVVLLDEPTRGIDVGAKIEIYEIINRLTADGKAVILVSSELPELIGMSDRILMLHEGRIIWRGPVSSLDNSGNAHVEQFVHGRAEGPIQPAL